MGGGGGDKTVSVLLITMEVSLKMIFSLSNNILLFVNKNGVTKYQLIFNKLVVCTFITKQPKIKMEVVRYQAYLHLHKRYSVKIRLCRTVSHGVTLEEP